MHLSNALQMLDMQSLVGPPASYRCLVGSKALLLNK